MTRIPDDVVRRIRRARGTHKAIGEREGVYPSTVTMIKNRTRRAKVEGNKNKFTPRISRRKLSDEDVEAIRKSDLKQDVLALMYGVCQPYISDLRNNRRRKSLS